MRQLEVMLGNDNYCFSFFPNKVVREHSVSVLGLIQYCLNNNIAYIVFILQCFKLLLQIYFIFIGSEKSDGGG